MLLVDSTVSNNVSYSDGGGIYNSGTANLYDDTIFANEAYTDGGGIANVGTLSLTSCTVASNAGWNNESGLPLYGGGVVKMARRHWTTPYRRRQHHRRRAEHDGVGSAANYSLIGNISGTTYSGSNNYLGFSRVWQVRWPTTAVPS